MFKLYGLWCRVKCLGDPTSPCRKLWVFGLNLLRVLLVFHLSVLAAGARIAVDCLALAAAADVFKLYGLWCRVKCLGDPTSPCRKLWVLGLNLLRVLLVFHLSVLAAGARIALDCLALAATGWLLRFPNLADRHRWQISRSLSL